MDIENQERSLDIGGDSSAQPTGSSADTYEIEQQSQCAAEAAHIEQPSVQAEEVCAQGVSAPQTEAVREVQASAPTAVATPQRAAMPPKFCVFCGARLVEGCPVCLTCQRQIYVPAPQEPPQTYAAAPQQDIQPQSSAYQQQQSYSQPAQAYQQAAQANSAAAPVYPQQAPAATRTATAGSGEFFVGINLLSKIGVIFIIVGVIAFTAVSQDFLSGEIRTFMTMGLGFIMAGLGEVFYRMQSRIFARALTLGGIAELFVSILIAHFGYHTLDSSLSLLIGLVMAALGILLSIRYDSQTVFVTAFVGIFLPAFTAGGDVWIAGAAGYLAVAQVAALIVAYKKQWFIAQYFGLICNAVISIQLFAAVPEGIGLRYISAAYATVSFLIYTGAGAVVSFRRSGDVSKCDSALILISAVASGLFTMIFFSAEGGTVMYGGIALGILAAVFFAMAGFSKAFFGNCDILPLFVHSALVMTSISLLTSFQGRYAYLVFHVYAAALILIGYLANIRTAKIWGIITGVMAEMYFFSVCLMHIQESIFMVQFIVNTALWLGIMIVLAARKLRGGLFSAYSIITMCNIGFFGLYMVYRLLKAMEISGTSENLFYVSIFSAAIWMILGFVSGKLKFLGKAAPIGSLCMYGLSLTFLAASNMFGALVKYPEIMQIITALIINFVSVLAVLDVALTIQRMAPKFACAVGMVVSGYAMFTVTTVLGSNDLVAFTSYLISVLYILVSAAWIIIGFVRENALLRRCGLALALFSAAKLFLFDFPNADAVARTLLFIGFGLVLLVIAFVYALFEKRLKDRNR